MKKMIAAFVACVIVFGAITACAKKNDEAEAKRIQDSIRVADSVAAAAAAEIPAVDTTAVVDSAAAAAAAVPADAPVTK